MNRRSFLSSSIALSLAATLPWSKSLSAQPSALLRLSSNENPLGMSPSAIAAAREALNGANRYGAGEVFALAGEIAELEGMDKSMVTIGNGSTGIIEAVMRQQALKGATLVQPDVTYTGALGAAESAKMPIIRVPMAEGFVVDLAAMEAAAGAVDGPVVVYLVTPNNPTGLLSPYADLADWIKRAPSNHFFMIDEAYHELVTDPAYQSCTKLIYEGHDNMIVLRTFSKIYAMAGMRLGYGLGAEKVISALIPHYSNWSISTPAVQAGRASLKDEAFKNFSLESNNTAKKITEEGLAAMGLNYIAGSQGNFLLHQIGMPLADYQQAMKREGVLVGRDVGLGEGWNRLSIGTADEMKQFLNILHELQQRGWK